MLGLRVPNIASFGARAAGQWWPWMCPPAHLWFFSAATLPRLVSACGFEVKEVTTLRGDGNNLYQYALMAAGNRLNDLRLRLRRGGSSAAARAGRGRVAIRPRHPRRREELLASCNACTAHAAALRPASDVARGRWTRAQPITECARAAHPLGCRTARTPWLGRRAPGLRAAEALITRTSQAAIRALGLIAGPCLLRRADHRRTPTQVRRPNLPPMQAR